MVQWQMVHDQEVVGSNPGTIYWMNVSDDASYYIKIKLKIKVAKWGTPKRYIEKSNHFKLQIDIVLFIQ
jgi:hypothetical protein